MQLMLRYAANVKVAMSEQELTKTLKENQTNGPNMTNDGRTM